MGTLPDTPAVGTLIRCLPMATMAILARGWTRPMV
ncbi:hypothetical protein BVRB_2g040940 [Beta vulgaris subsp. vulgaris]|nr:hypothetical protein BVRB_2g040940 [Beta vulgaris subsp. vulgaris]